MAALYRPHFPIGWSPQRVLGDAVDSSSVIYPHLPLISDGTEHPTRLNVTVCQSVDGQTYVEGQTWQLDSCTRCLCHAGRVLCSAPPCPPAACAEPVRPTGGCCGTCSVDSDQQMAGGVCTDAAGAERQDGDTWRQGACVSCACRDGEVSCFHEKCPPLDCVRPVLKKNHCCPVCLGKCRVEGPKLGDFEDFGADPPLSSG